MGLNGKVPSKVTQGSWNEIERHKKEYPVPKASELIGTQFDDCWILFLFAI